VPWRLLKHLIDVGDHRKSSPPFPAPKTPPTRVFDPIRHGEHRESSTNRPGWCRRAFGPDEISVKTGVTCVFSVKMTVYSQAWSASMPPLLRDTLLAFACSVLPPLGTWIAVEIRRRTTASLENTAAMKSHAEDLRANTAALRGPVVERQIHQHHKAKP
jgi:hypothetical protein